MVSQRSLNVLFVRSGDEGALPSSFRIGSRPERGTEIPFGLLRLASAVKFGSVHRVSLHDARHPSASKLRNAATILRPDVAVVWLHPALLAGGLEAARAVRHAGCPLVLGAGPLVDVWAQGARRIPELDGLLGSDDAAALLAALDVIASSGSAQSLASALSIGDGPQDDAAPARSLDCTLDRKLVDYAAYTASPCGWPPPQLPPPSRLMGLGGKSDKGRFAASRVVMSDLFGQPLPPEEVLADMNTCTLLGIPWQDLRPSSDSSAPDRLWWTELFAALKARSKISRVVPSRLRIQLSPAISRALPLTELRALAVVRLDLGDVRCSAPEDVDEALGAVRAGRRAGLESSLTALLGAPGGSLTEDERGLRALNRSAAQVDIQLRVTDFTEDPAAWSLWLDAPKPNFTPPGVDPLRRRLLGRGGAERPAPP